MTSSATLTGRRGWSGYYRQVSFLLLAILLLAQLDSPVRAQNNVGIGTTTPEASALLDLTSTDKGFLVPRMSNAQMLSIVLPATGLLVYNTTQSSFYYYNGSTWVPSLAAGSAWQTTGNTGMSAETNYLGTADANALAIRTNATQRMIILSSGEVGVGVGLPPSRFAVGDGNVSITNSTNAAGALHFYEPSSSGTNYTGFTAAAMASNIVYTLPTTAPATGQVLTAGATPTSLEWSTVAVSSPDTLWYVGGGTSSLVGRGNNNSAAGNYAIAAGLSNVASGNYSSVIGGTLNQASSNYSTVAGGQNNRATNVNASVLGGNNNVASGQYSVIGGGQSNNAFANYSGIASGLGHNIASGAVHAFIGGGQSNAASGQWAGVLSGLSNSADGNYSSVIGGQSNTVNSTHGIAGGYQTSLGSNANYSFVFGAGASVSQANSIVFQHTGAALTAGGPTKVGIRNLAPTEALDITGNIRFSGALMPNNLAGTAGQLLISGGANAAPTWSTGTGLFWSLTGNGGTSPSTNFLGTTDSIDFVFRTNNNEKLRLTGSGRLGIGTSAPAAKIELSNGDIHLTNTNNTAGRIRFNEPSSSGSNYTEFRARAQAANISYVLPDSAGQANDVLTTDANGNLYWSNNLITGSLYLGSTTTTTITSDANDFNLDVNYTLHRISSTGNNSITGLAGGVDGRVVIIVNVGNTAITMKFQNNGSSATNRIIGQNQQIVLNADAAVSLIYDGISSRWRVYGTY
jgi:hypothetical protein